MSTIKKFYVTQKCSVEVQHVLWFSNISRATLIVVIRFELCSNLQVYRHGTIHNTLNDSPMIV